MRSGPSAAFCRTRENACTKHAAVAFACLASDDPSRAMLFRNRAQVALQESHAHWAQELKREVKCFATT